MDLSEDLVAQARELGPATLHEAGGKVGALPACLRPLSLATSLAGPAYPVLSPPGDNLWIHEAIMRAEPGDVLVVSCSEDGYGYFGEVMAVACQVKGIAGLVIDGGVRDVGPILELGFPVFSSAVSINGTGKNPELSGRVGASLKFGTVTVNPGDLVVGDADGVVVLPAREAAATVGKGQQRVAEEAEFFQRMRAGESTFDIYGLPRVG